MKITIVQTVIVIEDDGSESPVPQEPHPQQDFIDRMRLYMPPGCSVKVGKIRGEQHGPFITQ